MRAWVNKGHKEPPQTFHHWLSFLDTRSWNLGILLLPDDWLSSRLHLPGHAAKTTAATGFLKKVEWKPDQIQSPIKRTTLSKGADSASSWMGGEGRKPLLPMRTSFQNPTQGLKSARG